MDLAVMPLTLWLTGSTQTLCCNTLDTVIHVLNWPISSPCFLPSRTSNRVAGDPVTCDARYGGPLRTHLGEHTAALCLCLYGFSRLLNRRSRSLLHALLNLQEMVPGNGQHHAYPILWAKDDGA